jgi:DNA polymerase III subunit epsilon
VITDLLLIDRRLVVPDVETTGVVVGSDRILQIALTIYDPGKDPIHWKTFVDPQMAIPPEASHKHKITDADIAGAPTWEAIGPALASRLRRCDFAGYNVDFDLKVLKAEFQRVGVEWDWEADGALVVDAKVIYFLKHPRTLVDAYREYVNIGGFEGSHDAGNDVAATIAVLEAQLARHADLPRSVAGLAAFCDNRRPDWVDRRGKVVWRGAEACISFGKHAGNSLRAMAGDRAGRSCGRGYLEWMASDKADFPADTKAIVRRALDGEFPARG